MTSRGRHRAVAVAVVVMILVVGVGAFIEMGRTDEGSDTFDLYSTLSPAPDGARALYALLGELGYRTRRELSDFEKLDPAGADIVMMLGPVLPLTAAEEERLEAFVEAGGTVFVAGEMLMGSAMYSRPRTGAGDPFALHHPDGGDLPRAEGDPEWTEKVSPLAAELFAGVDRVAWKPVLGKTVRSVDVDVTGPVPARGDHVVLVTRDQRSFVEVSTLGLGRVVKVAQVDPFINGNIRKADNLVLVLNVLEASKGEGRVLFDEAHRRLGPAEQPDVWDVLGPAAELAFLQLLLATAAGLVALGWRRAAPLAEREVRRRRALDQVKALAGMLEQAGAAGLAIRLVHGRARRLQAAGRLGSAPGMRGADPVETQAKTFAELERMADDARDRGKATASDLARYAKLYSRIVKKETRG